MDYYIGLGDSVSISSYPSMSAGLGISARVGAIDLTGEELMKLGLVKGYYNLAVDGAEIPDVFNQIGKVSRDLRLKANVLSLTIGGNDNSFAAMRRPGHYRQNIEHIIGAYDGLIAWLLKQFPNSVLLINNSYDVTDQTGVLPDCGRWSSIIEDYSQGRRELGDHIRTVYGSLLDWERIIFHDLFKHFDGKGMKSGTVYSNGWYYKDFLIEPGHVGAQEISGLWVQSVINFVRKSQTENHLAFTS